MKENYTLAVYYYLESYPFAVRESWSLEMLQSAVGCEL